MIPRDCFLSPLKSLQDSDDRLSHPSNTEHALICIARPADAHESNDGGITEGGWEEAHNISWVVQAMHTGRAMSPPGGICAGSAAGGPHGPDPRDRALQVLVVGVYLVLGLQLQLQQRVVHAVRAPTV
jgi:hypothetical protein